MIELTTSLVLFLAANGLNAVPAASLQNTAFAQEKQVKETVVETPTVDASDAPLTLEMYVREYFKDTPVLAEISRCESRFKHYDKNGELIRGLVTPADVGVMQINEKFHGSTAKQLGLDIHTIDGNLAYAKYLYKKYGVAPWSASSKCWNNGVQIATY